MVHVLNLLALEFQKMYYDQFHGNGLYDKILRKKKKTIGFFQDYFAILMMIVRFKLPNMYICFSRMIVTRSYLRACDIALCHIHSCLQISFQSGFSIATCFRSLVFCSSFLPFYSSFFVYFFASPDQRNICKFTLCFDFQLVHQSLRNIVIYFLSVEPLFLIIDLHVHHNAFGLPRNFDLIKL